MTGSPRPAAVLVAVMATVGLGAMSRVPYTAERGTDAYVRLAWRVRGERVETCRRLSREELERIPAHMRREEVCEGHIVPYLLEVTVDGALAARESVASKGARADRPLYVFREIPVSPGRHRLRVSFSRLGAIPAGQRERGSLPERLDLDTIVTLGPRHVSLVTYDEDRRLLAVKGRSATGPP